MCKWNAPKWTKIQKSIASFGCYCHTLCETLLCTSQNTDAKSFKDMLHCAKLVYSSSNKVIIYTSLHRMQHEKVIKTREDMPIHNIRRKNISSQVMYQYVIAVFSSANQCCLQDYMSLDMHFHKPFHQLRGVTHSLSCH